MAKELGLSHRNRIKNIPSWQGQWKAPVEDWVRLIYEKRHGAKSHREHKGAGTAPPEIKEGTTTW